MVGVPTPGPTAGDLTSAPYWDAVWQRSSRRRQWIGVLRARLPWVREYDEMLGALVDRAASGRTIDVLELGCAPGTMLVTLHRLRPLHHYHGLDIAPEGLEQARRRSEAAGISASLRLGDMRDTDVGDGVDLVVSFGLMEHFEDPAAAMAAHTRFARPGGAVAVAVPNYAHPVVRSLLARFSPDTLTTHNLAMMHEEALRRAMLAAGLTDIATGQALGPILPNSRTRHSLAGYAYGFAARAWNLAVPAVPLLRHHLWEGLIWAFGKRP